MNIRGPGWGGDVPSRSIPPKSVPLDMETSGATPPTLPDKKPLIKEDGFFKSTENPAVANLGLTSPKSNDVAGAADGAADGWMSLGTVVKSDAVTSRQPTEATKEQKQDITTVLAKHMGPDTSRLLGIMGNFA
jgi:hypothetical protein